MLFKMSKNPPTHYFFRHLRKLNVFFIQILLNFSKMVFQAGLREPLSFLEIYHDHARYKHYMYRGNYNYSHEFLCDYYNFGHLMIYYI